MTSKLYQSQLKNLLLQFFEVSLCGYFSYIDPSSTRFWVILLADRQTDIQTCRQRSRQTDKRTRANAFASPLSEVNNAQHHLISVTVSCFLPTYTFRWNIRIPAIKNVALIYYCLMNIDDDDSFCLTSLLISVMMSESLLCSIIAHQTWYQ